MTVVGRLELQLRSVHERSQVARRKYFQFGIQVAEREFCRNHFNRVTQQSKVENTQSSSNTTRISSGRIERRIRKESSKHALANYQTNALGQQDCFRLSNNCPLILHCVIITLFCDFFLCLFRTFKCLASCSVVLFVICELTKCSFFLVIFVSFVCFNFSFNMVGYKILV